MSAQVVCPGIPAGWLNGWLAAVGATVLDARIRLHWTSPGNVAVLSSTGLDPLDVLAESWPDDALLCDLPIAEHWRQAGVVGRKVPVDSFATRAREARDHPLSWSLSSTMTDLCVDRNGEVAHAPLDPAGPGTVKWLHHRLMKVHRHVADLSPEAIGASLAGEAERVKDNGLGFDSARLGSLADKTDPWIDPVVEVLAFFGLAVLPMRGRGSDGRLDRSAFGDERQRGWVKMAGNRRRRFTWPAWNHPLDAYGIDALLDVWKPAKRALWPLHGVHAGWGTVSFEPKDRADTTRAFGSERL